MTHLDLFSGIGGFAYAIDQVWPDMDHIFCDNEPFAQQVLRKHWPEAHIYNDVRNITEQNWHGLGGFTNPITLLTGGFPCQPYSAAGLRRGTTDERHLWPEMFRVIRLTEPEWVVAENVYGLLDWNDGVVFEQVCTDLEAAGYEVQPFVIPAVAVDAPHKRNRVWFIAHAVGRTNGRGAEEYGGEAQEERLPERHEMGKSGQPSKIRDVDDTEQPGLEGYGHADKTTEGWQEPQRPATAPAWDRDWPQVAAELCGVDDGLPVELGQFKLSKSQHRKEQLKAYGNAIVPAVAVEIFKAIKESERISA